MIFRMGTLLTWERQHPELEEWGRVMSYGLDYSHLLKLVKILQ
jgi:hypothetical protein